MPSLHLDEIKEGDKLVIHLQKFDKDLKTEPCQMKIYELDLSHLIGICMNDTSELAQVLIGIESK